MSRSRRPATANPHRIRARAPARHRTGARDPRGVRPHLRRHRPGCARLVGRVLATTHDLPWHRVVRADGRIPQGPPQRELLLQKASRCAAIASTSTRRGSRRSCNGGAPSLRAAIDEVASRDPVLAGWWPVSGRSPIAHAIRTGPSARSSRDRLPAARGTCRPGDPWPAAGGRRRGTDARDAERNIRPSATSRRPVREQAGVAARSLGQGHWTGRSCFRGRRDEATTT